jgi:hypothetical protein
LAGARRQGAPEGSHGNGNRTCGQKERPISDRSVFPCSRCGRTVTDLETVETIGLMEGADGLPLILYQCRCHNTLAIPWAKAPEELKGKVRREAEAYFATLQGKGPP